MRTQVGIVGAGPAGLVLAQLLQRAGIESVVLECRSRAYVEQRIRAGVLEQGTADLLVEAGVGDRMRDEGLVHHGIWLRFEGENHYVPMTELTGRTIVVYGQTEVVKDLIEARLAAGLPLLFEAEATAIDGAGGERPCVRFRVDGSEEELECDVVAACDGFHGIGRRALPPGLAREYAREYPFGWLGVLAQVPPASDELIYAWNDDGFALQSMRSPELSRLYLQCRPDEDLGGWPDERIWAELQARLGLPGFEGPILERGVTGMRSYVCEPMQHGRLFLAGDAAHIVPPTGAKGLNLAVHDVRVLADALVRHFRDGDDSGLADYSQTCLRRVWRAEHFSWWMTSMLHRAPGADPFDAKLQLSQLRYVTTSEPQARALAENYVGLEHV